MEQDLPIARNFLLPGGNLFIAGPQKPPRRFDPGAAAIIDNPALQYNQISSQRGVNIDGTAVLLPLKPPNYEPRIMVLGGSAPDAQQTAEWIDLSVANPAWQALPNLNVTRDKVNSVLLPDGRVLVVGGIETLPDGGPAEIFDPEDPTSGFQLGPNMAHVRCYHSAALLLPDGSVVNGGRPKRRQHPNSTLVFLQAAASHHQFACNNRLRCGVCRSDGSSWSDRGDCAIATGCGHPRLQPEPTVRRLRHHGPYRDGGASVSSS